MRWLPTFGLIYLVFYVKSVPIGTFADKIQDSKNGDKDGTATQLHIDKIEDNETKNINRNRKKRSNNGRDHGHASSPGYYDINQNSLRNGNDPQLCTPFVDAFQGKTITCGNEDAVNNYNPKQYPNAPPDKYSEDPKYPDYHSHSNNEYNSDLKYPSYVHSNDKNNPVYSHNQHSSNVQYPHVTLPNEYEPKIQYSLHVHSRKEYSPNIQYPHHVYPHNEYDPNINYPHHVAYAYGEYTQVPEYSTERYEDPFYIHNDLNYEELDYEEPKSGSSEEYEKRKRKSRKTKSSETKSSETKSSESKSSESKSSESGSYEEELKNKKSKYKKSAYRVYHKFVPFKNPLYN